MLAAADRNRIENGTPDRCDRCRAALVAGDYGGGCQDCDLLLCPPCSGAHPIARCRGRFA
jgi:hypothetical protein